MSADGPQGSGGYQPSPSSSGEHVADPMLGHVVDGRYKITAKLGEGGMGEVYAAEHVHIEKRVAVKVLRAEILSNQEAVKRFRQEARASSSIGHKNIIQIEDFGEMKDGRIYLCMELLDGMPFNDLIESGTVTMDRMVHILIQTGHGLAAAHAKNIVHRDMKPENIFVTGGDVPKLLDFGIAKVSGADGNNHLTRTGTIFGTPFYMAPEQALGQNVDHRADIYAMGVIMYEVFCGSVPFTGESFMGILTQHITAEPMAPGQRAQQHGIQMPAGVEEIIVKAMKKDPNDRYQSMDELVQSLVGIYRSVSGSGMSAYMQAHQPPPSMGVPVANPADSTLAQSAGPYSSPHGTPMMQTPPPQTGPGSMAGPPPQQTGPGSMAGPPGIAHQQRPPTHQTGQPSQPYSVPSSSQYPAVSSDEYMAPTKSRAWIWIVLILLLAGGGGAAGFILYKNSQKKVASDEGADKPDEGADEPDEGGDEPDEGGDKPDEGGDKPDEGGDKPDEGGDKPDETATGNPDKPDESAEKTPDAGQAILAPPKKVVSVLVDTTPDGAKVVLDGTELSGRTPLIVEFEEGAEAKIVLKRRNHRDRTETLDGSKKKVKFRLKKTRTTKPPPPDKPPPKLKYCDRPENKNKIKCFCRKPKNKNKPKCLLE